MGKRPFYRKIRRTLYETVSDSGNSVFRYRGHDDKEYYVASSNDPNIGSGGGMIEVTWQELKNKRDAGELIPGSFYRITDYQCTTTQENTKSAGHQFDIVLLALSENKLAEEGWAMHHANDTYFANSNLSAWKVWYCLDNDKSRFAWADDSEDFSIPNTIKVSNKLYIRNVNSDRTYDNNQYYAWSSGANNIYYTLSENPEINDVIYKWVPDPFSDEAGVYVMHQQSVGISAVTSGYEGRAKEAIITCYNELHNNLSFKRDTTTNNGVIIDNGITYYTWVQEDNLNNNVYTLSECPEVGDLLYRFIGLGGGLQQFAEISSYQPPIHYYNGRGVIYRLVDEWNNDVAYDFKNIQYIRKLTDGEYDADNGEDTWCYTFSDWELHNSFIYDISLKYDVEYHALNNRILSIPDNSQGCVKLGDIVLLYIAENNIITSTSDCTFESTSNTECVLCMDCFFSSFSSMFRNCSSDTFNSGVSQIWINNKIVLTES